MVESDLGIPISVPDLLFNTIELPLRQWEKFQRRLAEYTPADSRSGSHEHRDQFKFVKGIQAIIILPVSKLFQPGNLLDKLTLEIYFVRNLQLVQLLTTILGWSNLHLI